ncbi:MAG: TCR/Tet family MFS transporter [Syntrophomonadaceae bacterium]|nr:TCR/Tet family MFS transporter [Syntrophomonadaceae bacterium]
MSEKTEKGGLLVLFISIFLVGVGFSIIMPVLPYYAESLGANAFQLGLLITVYAICQFIFAPIWGTYSDRLGRKPVLLMGIVGFAVTFILFAFATKLWQLYLIRIAGGIMSCATMPTAMAYVADTTSIENRGKSMGLIGAAMGIGMIFGPAIGGLLSEVSLGFPFLFSGLLALVNSVGVLLILKESLPEENRIYRRIQRVSLLAGLKTPLALLFVFMLLASTGEAIHHGTFALFTGAKLGFTARDIGWSFTAAGVASTLVQGMLVGRFINRVGEEKTALTGITLMGLSFVLFIFTFDVPSSIVFMFVFAAGVGLMRPSISSAVSKRAESGQGFSMGVLQGYDSLGRAIGPALGGFMLDMGLNLGYLTAISISVLAIVTMVVGSRSKVKLASQG